MTPRAHFLQKVTGVIPALNWGFFALKLQLANWNMNQKKTLLPELYLFSILQFNSCYMCAFKSFNLQPVTIKHCLTA